MKNRKMIAILLVSSLAATVFCGPAYAGRRVKPIAEQLAERAILETPQEKTLRLGEDGKPRVIITSDLEIDDDERNLFITTWGGFNTVARAFLSIYEQYNETEEWEAIYQKVCDKAIIIGNGQDWTYEDYIKEYYR